MLFGADREGVKKCESLEGCENAYDTEKIRCHEQYTGRDRSVCLDTAENAYENCKTRVRHGL